MQTGLSVNIVRPQVDSMFHQEIDHIVSPVFTSPQKARLHLRFCRYRFQAAIIFEEPLDYIEPSYSSRSLQIQSRAAPGQKLGSFAASIAQCHD